jgi:hypothetical protein
MNDATKLIYVPLWLRIVSILVLGMALVVAFVAIFVFMHQPDRETYVLTAMALAQVSASGLIIVLIVFYSRREIGTGGIRKRNDSVLAKELPEALENMNHHPFFGKDYSKPVPVKCHHIPGDVIARYEITLNNALLRMSVTFNVKRLVVIYYFPAESEDMAARLEEELENVINGAINAGYQAKMRFTASGYSDGAKYHTLYLYNNLLPDDFLLDPLQKLYWLTDISIMTRSVAVSANRVGSHFVLVRQ